MNHDVTKNDLSEEEQAELGIGGMMDPKGTVTDPGMEFQIEEGQDDDITIEDLLESSQSVLNESQQGRAAFDVLVRKSISKIPGFYIEKGQVRVKNVKRALSELARAHVSGLAALANTQHQMTQVVEVVRKMERHISTLASDPALVQIIATAAAQLLIDKAPEFEAAMEMLHSLEFVERGTPGSLEIARPAPGVLAFVYHKPGEDGEVIRQALRYNELPEVFLTSLTNRMIEDDFRLAPGESSSIVFDGLQNILDALPEEAFAAIQEAELDAAIAETEEIAKTYDAKTTALVESEEVVDRFITPGEGDTETYDDPAILAALKDADEGIQALAVALSEKQ